MTTPTTKPVPSNDPRDLLFNAEKLDQLSNTNGYLVNRVGNSIPTYITAIAELGFNAPVTFASGINADSSRITVEYSGDRYFARPDATPFITTGTFNPAQWSIFNEDFPGSNVPQLDSYTLLRAYAGSATLVYVTGFLIALSPVGIAGNFVYDPSDTTSADNGGTIIVGSDERRWKRRDATTINPLWFEATGKGLVDDYANMNRAAQFAAKNHMILDIPDGVFLMSDTITIDYTALGITNFRCRGLASTTGVASAYAPDRAGTTLIMTGGNKPIFSLLLNNFFAENFVFNGINFLHGNFYPAAQPKSTLPAVYVEKGVTGNVSLNRYTTDNLFINCSFVWFAAAVLFKGRYLAPDPLTYNYYGPTKFENCSLVNNTNSVVMEDCTFNYLVFDTCQLFGSDGAGIDIRKSVGGTGGTVQATFRNTLFEGLKGIFRIDGVVGARNSFSFYDCQREFCQPFSGASPMGTLTNTDLLFYGMKDKAIAYGEDALIRIDAGNTITSDTPMSVNMFGGATNSKDQINVIAAETSIGVGETKTVQILTTDTTSSARTALGNIRVVLNSGASGVVDISSVGQKNGTTYQHAQGVLPSFITIAASNPAGTLFNFIINNTTGGIIYVGIDGEFGGSSWSILVT